jgi:CBS domain containing-hemolysin-like protein
VVSDLVSPPGDFSLLQRHVRAFVLWQAGVQLCDADTTVAQLAAQMSKAHVRRLFLVNNEKDRHVVGIVTASDVCGALFRAFRDQAKDEKKSSKKQQEPGKGKGKTKWQSHLEKQSNKKSSKGGNKSAAKKK